MKNQDTTRNRGSGITWRRQLLWELRWTAVEMAGVGLGLYLLLRAGQNTAGMFVLCGILVASFLVRSRHYRV
jgi:hypothetical protein